MISKLLNLVPYLLFINLSLYRGGGIYIPTYNYINAAGYKGLKWFIPTTMPCWLFISIVSLFFFTLEILIKLQTFECVPRANE